MRDVERDRLEAELAEWVLHHPEVWPIAKVVPLSDEQADRLVASIVAGERLVGRPGLPGPRPRRWQRRKVCVGTGVFVALAGASLGAAALLRSGQPSVPEAGIVCRAAAAVDANALVVAPGPDPVAACRLLWEAGEFDELAEVGVVGVVPPLVACIGGGGAVEVFPGGPSVCGELGLVVADAVLSAGNEAIVGLQDRVVEQINAVGCLSVDDAAIAAEAILAESGLEGWRVVAYSASGDEMCGRVGVDGSTRTVVVSGA